MVIHKIQTQSFKIIENNDGEGVIFTEALINLGIPNKKVMKIMKLMKCIRNLYFFSIKKSTPKEKKRVE